MPRISRDSMFLRMACNVSGRGTCPRAQVGAVIVDSDNQPLSIGYNGSPAGQPHCSDVGCSFVELEGGETLGCQRVVHAEANAIYRASRRGIAVGQDAKIYCTYSPCRRCLEAIVSSGIYEVIYAKAYRATPWELAESLGVVLRIARY